MLNVWDIHLPAECTGNEGRNKLSSGAIDTGFSTTTILLPTLHFSEISGQQCQDFWPATSSLPRSSNLQLFSFSEVRLVLKEKRFHDMSTIQKKHVYTL